MHSSSENHFYFVNIKMSQPYSITQRPCRLFVNFCNSIERDTKTEAQYWALQLKINTVSSNRFYNLIGTIKTFNKKSSTPAHQLNSQMQQTTNWCYKYRMGTGGETPETRFSPLRHAPCNADIFNRWMCQIPQHTTIEVTAIYKPCFCSCTVVYTSPIGLLLVLVWALLSCSFLLIPKITNIVFILLVLQQINVLMFLGKWILSVTPRLHHVCIRGSYHTVSPVPAAWKQFVCCRLTVMDSPDGTTPHALLNSLHDWQTARMQRRLSVSRAKRFQSTTNHAVTV